MIVIRFPVDTNLNLFKAIKGRRSLRRGKKKKQKKPLSWLAKETGVIAKAVVTEFHPICLKAHHRESARHFKEGVEPDTDGIPL